MDALTIGARRRSSDLIGDLQEVASRAELAERGIGPAQIVAQVRAARWQLLGCAVVLHNGVVTVSERRLAALVNCGPRSALTSFTAAEAWGLRGWEREEIHVLVPAGTRPPTTNGVRLHRSADWSRSEIAAHRRLHRLAPALVLAASSFRSTRPACGILPAAVQQRLILPSQLRAALAAAPKIRHRRAMRAAIDDIEQGAHSLSEIDFVRLCRKHGLPAPTKQAVRCDSSGRRRYLDVEWRLPDGRVVAVDVDGALHLTARQWVDDQLRQNEVVIDGTVVLRYPSVVVREEPWLVVAQLQRALSVPDR